VALSNHVRASLHAVTRAGVQPGCMIVLAQLEFYRETRVWASCLASPQRITQRQRVNLPLVAIRSQGCLPLLARRQAWAVDVSGKRRILGAVER
jgi:hypothetical protein